MPTMTPLADPNLQGGNLFSAGVGMNVTLPEGHRLAVEYNKEPQDDTLTLAWQYAF